MVSTSSPRTPTSYRGRFAPSPTGRLHLGSLLSGYGAMWRARSQNGTFLVRIEDLDFTRCTTLNLALMYHDLQLFHLLSEEQILVPRLAALSSAVRRTDPRARSRHRAL